MYRRALPSLLLAALLSTPVSALDIAVSFSEEQSSEPIDGRILLLLSTNDEDEPRNQIAWDATRRASRRVVTGIGLGWRVARIDHPGVRRAPLLGQRVPA